MEKIEEDFISDEEIDQEIIREVIPKEFEAINRM